MAKYDEAFKRRVVDESLSGPLATRALSQKYGIDRSMLRRWINAWQRHGQAGSARKRATYGAGFKLRALLLQRRSIPPRSRRGHDGKVAVDKTNKRWCSDGFEFCCDNGEPLRVTFDLDCCDRETPSWAAATGGHSGDVVRDFMLAAVEHRFGNAMKAPAEIEWGTDNGSGYTADKTEAFESAIGRKPLTTPVCSPQSNGMAESFVKTMKRDYVAFMPKPDAQTAARNLAIAFEHYNEQHPHSALNYRSPWGFRRAMALSIQRCDHVRGYGGKSNCITRTSSKSKEIVVG